MDWNWFFSSFSQSAAALIAIISGFVITKVIEINGRRTILGSEMTGLDRIRNKIISETSKIDFYQFTKMKVKENEVLLNKIKAGEFEGLSRKRIINKIYKNDISPYKIDSAVYEAYCEILDVYSKNNLSNYRKDKDTKMNIKDSTQDIGLDKIENKISRLEIESNYTAYKYKESRYKYSGLELEAKNLKKIISKLMIVFPVLIFCPLFFLPYNTNIAIVFSINVSFIIKALLLIVLLITVEGGYYYLFRLTKGTEVTATIMSNEEDMKFYGEDVKKYCEYFNEDKLGMAFYS